jgi:hypothetical protein
MEYEGSEKASSFGRWLVRMVMDGAPQHVLSIAAAILAHTGQRSCAASFSFDEGRAASEDSGLPSE